MKAKPFIDGGLFLAAGSVIPFDLRQVNAVASYIKILSDDLQSKLRRMDPNLVGAQVTNLRFPQTVGAISPQKAESRMAFLARPVGYHHSLAICVESDGQIAV